MREILFRGRHIVGKGWCAGDLINTKGAIPPYMPMIMQTVRKTGEAMAVDVDPDTIGQYTGLKDKNGRRIFEGDIVVIGEHNQAVNGRYSVVWSAENHCWGLERSTEYHHHYFTFSALNGFSESAEVIGNIHDNPELMEVQK